MPLAYNNVRKNIESFAELICWYVLCSYAMNAIARTSEDIIIDVTLGTELMHTTRKPFFVVIIICVRIFFLHSLIYFDAVDGVKCEPDSNRYANILFRCADRFIFAFLFVRQMVSSSFRRVFTAQIIMEIILMKIFFIRDPMRSAQMKK